MDFLTQNFYLNVQSDPNAPEYRLPNYLSSRYDIKNIYIENQPICLVAPRFDLEHINSVKNHLQEITSANNIPAVLLLNKVTMQERRALIQSGIPFIVKNKQCYLPLLGTLLTERCDSKVHPVEKLLPSAQMLLFHYIYQNQRELLTNNTIASLHVSAMTITRASRQLEQLGLIKIHKAGVQKVMTTDYTPQELYLKAKKYLISPIKNTIYVDKSIISDTMLLAGDSALAIRTMLNQPWIACYATTYDKKLAEYGSATLFDDANQVELQLWKYNPMTLSADECIDILSLACCYAETVDERIEEEVNEMLEDFWRDLR